MWPEPPTTDTPRSHGSHAAVVGFSIGLLANAAVLGLTIQFYQAASRLHPGTGVRPMALASAFVGLAFAAFIAGTPLSVLGAINGRRWLRIIGITGVFLNLSPLPLSMFALNIAIRRAGVVAEP